MVTKAKIINNAKFKKCTHCSKFKTVDNFYKVKNGKFGVMATCKHCISEKRKQKYHSNKEYRQQRVKQAKQYYQDHKEHVKAYVKQWIKDYPEGVDSYAEKW